jgi:hypothetical protein
MPINRGGPIHHRIRWIDDLSFPNRIARHRGSVTSIIGESKSNQNGGGRPGDPIRAITKKRNKKENGAQVNIEIDRFRQNPFQQYSCQNKKTNIPS